MRAEQSPPVLRAPNGVVEDGQRYWGADTRYYDPSKVSEPSDDEMRDEYDLRGGVRGKYYERYKEGTNIVLLEPDVYEVFKDSSAVNDALRQYLAEHGGKPPRKKRAG